MFNVFQLLDGYRGDAVCAWMRANLELPSVVTVLYIVMVLYVPRTFMKHRPAYDLRVLNIFWNLFLSLFSFAGAYYCLPQVYKSLFVSEFTVRNYAQGGSVTLHGSFYNGVCGWNDNLFCDGPVGAFVAMFILSKIPEMIDTVFLVFQKKKIIFLHWYHHATVMLYCWHSYAVKISGGLVFASMNYGVHSVMYLYFFLCACGYRKYVRPIAPVITFLQIAQMVAGMFVEAATLYHMYASGKGCQSNATNARVGLMMYISYFGLFSKLFYDNYMHGGSTAMVRFLENFRGDNVCQWMAEHLEVPVLAVGLYMVMVLYIPDAYMKDREAFDLRQLNKAWNLLLTVFSFAGAYYCLPQLYRTIFVPAFDLHDYATGGVIPWKGGVYNAFCYWNNNVFYDGPVGAFVAMFILSKIPEMIDTAFLVFQKKKIIFLHWYHHITVMLYCWHAYMYNISGGLVFAGMNYGVHSIMYFYYFLCACGYRKVVRPFASLITFLQIAQMVVGMFTEVYTLYILYFTDKRCDSNATNARLGFLMYLSYFILFSKLFYDSYINPPQRAASAAPKLNGSAAAPANGEAAAMKVGK